MIKAILLDCGGVMVSPTLGDWLLPPCFERVLGEDFADVWLDRFRRARAKHIHLLPDTLHITTDEEEFLAFLDFFPVVFAEMGRPLSGAECERLAALQVYRDDRYSFFGDVFAYLKKWRAKYRIGIVSDAPPSTERILRNAGIMDLVHGATFSFELGVLKPHRSMFEAALSKFDIEPSEAVFVDDYPSKMSGALELGIHCVQMRRPMPHRFNVPDAWEGDIVQGFEELDGWLLKA